MKIVIFWVVTPYSLVDTYVADVSEESAATRGNLRNGRNFVPDFPVSSQKKVILDPKYIAVFLNIVACIAVAMQRPRDGRVYQGRFWATAR
jgi:hypothetical protein